MADKSVGELIAAQSVTPTDLFVLEQNGTAKKLTGQILENWLVSFADGHGGIHSIEKLSTNVLEDTYRITLADTTTFDFVVTNGRSITGISKTSTSGLVDTYTISYNNGTTSKFTVTNGAKGDKGDDAYVWIKYASQEPTESSHSIGDIPDDWIGIYSGNASTAPTDWKQYKWFKHKGEHGDTGDPATLVSSTVVYQASASGTIIPSGTWSASIPAVAQGKYLWTKIVQTFNTGSPISAYTVSRMGVDGLGSVTSVNHQSPDVNGNVNIDASAMGALSKLGDTMEGALDMGDNKITNLATPTDDNDAVSRKYVDDGLNKKLSKELVWKNASPTSSFGEQEITLADNDATEYEVHFRMASGENFAVFRIKVGETAVASIVRASNGVAVGNWLLAIRHFEMRSKTKIKFYGGYYSTSALPDHYVSVDDWGIPMEVYAIKGVSA